MNKKTNSLEKRIINSNLKITKNFLYYLIVPAVILIVGIILLCTVGFNLGTDFTGSSSFKIFVNNEAVLEDAAVYDLSDAKDYNTVYGKVESVLEDNQLKIVSYRTSTLNLMDSYNVPNGQAVEVVFQNNEKSLEDINLENEELRQALIVEFDYSNFDQAITSIDYSPAQSSYSWAMGILATVVFGLIAAVIYMMFRYNKSAWIVLTLQVAFDMILFLGLLSIFRLTVNLTVGISILTTFTLSIISSFVFYSRMKENINSGKYTNMKNNEMGDSNVKEGLYKKSLIYFVMLVLSFILAIIAVEGVREVALGIAIALITTFYTSTFLTPAIWSVVYKEKKKKQTQN